MFNSIFRFLIKNLVLKFYKEALTFLIFSGVILFAISSLGFSNENSTQFNKEIWLSALLNFNRNINPNSLSSNSTIDNSTAVISNDAISGNTLKEINIFDPSAFGIPKDTIPTDTTIITDTSKTVTPRSLFDTTKIDTGKVDTILNDTSRVIDTLRRDTVSVKGKVSREDSLRLDRWGKDSTARLEHFKYYREDRPYTTLRNYKPSSFFVTPSENIRRKVIEIDSTGQFVEIKEIVAGKPAKIILRMPISEYVALKMELREREMWEKLGYEYQLKEGKKGLSELIKDITDFEIPLPSVGVLSIFGEPKIRLNIGGAVDITGAWRNETTEGITANRLGNTRNEPNFNQKVQINVNGTIGDKLNISADWNTERTFEYENQLKIKYTGYEDEIIQSIEAGNVSLQTSPLVGGSEALFGIKGQFRLGPLTLTALASQKKGETKEQTLSSGGTTQPFTIRAYDYSKNHYFIDTIYANSELWNSFYGNPTPEYNPALYVVDIEVWKSTTALNPQNERSVNAYIDLEPVGLNGTYDPALKQTINGGDGRIETGRFIKLDASDYEIQRETGRLTFKTNIQETDIIAVAYRLQNGPGPEDDQFYGEFSTGTNKEQTLVLKLVKPKNLQPQYTQAWRLQLKNIYGIQGRDVKKEGFEFYIKRDIPGSDPVSNEGSIRFLEAFGLDKYNATQQSTPDGVFDFDPGITIIPSTGEIIFPVLEPFGRDIPAGLDSLAWQSIYTSTVNDARREQTKDKWLLTGKYSGSVSSKFNLGFNVVQNSVKVKLNGSELTAGVDYIVDYNVGELIIRNDAALNPGADLKITYEENDLLQLASKTLVGARGLFDFTEKTKLGFSILNLNQETLNDKVRIGEEPLSNTIYGLDFQHTSDLPFITKGLDKYYSTKEASSFSLSGEYAYINPDPNTKKSTILSDRNRSIAYIDDFEGAKRVIPIGVSYTQWKDISIPDRLPALDTITDPFRKLFHKGKSFWFTITPSDVVVDDIWGGRKQTSKTDDQVSVLDFIYIPDTPGTYNYNPDTLDITRSWGGMQKILSSTANNLIEEHIEFIEFWINVQKAPPGAKMYLDLGRISEDVYPNRELNTEDLPPRNDAIDPEGKEDVGFDNMTNDQERAFAAQRGYPTATSPDPSNDDFDFNTGRISSVYDYYNINGLEGNAKLSDIGRLPDTEDLNRNNTIDQTNSYFRYEVPLDTANNPFKTGDASSQGWFLIRVPLKDTTLGVGNPQFTNVETIRMFITGADSLVHLRIAEFNLVGSQWEKQVTNNGQLAMEDEVLSISVVNIEDNPEYKSPAGVIQERDRSKPDEEILKNEQSLNLILNGLPAGDKREAVKNLYRELDVFNYKEMKLFIHGDENTSAQSISVDSTAEFYNSEVFFRFGSDSNNYYEYRQPVRSGWNEISIAFEKLTAIKQSRSDSVNLITRELVEGTRDHYYLIKGNPTLTRIKFLSVGVFNATAERGDPTYLSGSVWVNELRVIGADDSPGWAYQVNSSIKMADLLTVNMNLSQQNPFFHRLAERFGSRVDTRNWGVSADLDVLKLIPTRMAESNLRIQYSHTESVGNPLYLPGTDIKVSEAQRQLQEPNTGKGSSKRKSPEQLEIESQSINTSDSYNASGIKIKIPSNYWLIRDTWNALTFNFNYNKSFSRNPNTERADYWIWNAGITYGINLSPEYYFMPVKIPVIGSIIGLLDDYKNLRIYYAPSVFAADMNARRSRNTMVTRELLNAPSQYTVTRDFGATRGFNFTWKVTEGGFLNLTTNYSVDATSSLAHLETDEFGMQRKESKIWKDIFTGVLFGNDIDFVQVVDLKSSPKLPSFLGNYFTLTAGYSVNYSWRNDLKSTLGRSAGYANKTNLSMNLKLKSLVAPWFKEETTVDPKNQQQQQPQQQTIKRGRDRNLDIQDPNKKDTSVVAVDSTKMQDSVDNKPKQSALTGALKFLKNIAYITLFDYETISMNYTNDNSLRKSGLYGGGTGFANFWGAKFKDEYGPSRGFIFGLGGDVGRRAPGGNVSDNASYRNNLDFRTSKPLWEGARIELNWKIGWTMNKNVTLRTDEFGNGSITNINSTGTISRSFLSVPPFMIFSFLKSGIKRVHEIDPTGDNLSTSFVEGFETLPLLSKIGFLKDIAKYIPRPNWKISWNGLEKLFFFKWAKTVSFDHAYSSNLQEGWKLTPGVGTEVQSQKIDYGFAPLIGLNFNFGEVWGGNFTANTKYNVRTGFSLNATNVNITEDFSRDFGITANYSKSGFEIPLFGISLKNDIEFMFSYSMGKNSEVQYNMKEFTEEGIPQSGSTRTTIEPRIRYTISSKVNLTLFYKRTSVEPEAGSSIIGTTTNEGGLEVHISIQ